MYNRNAVPDSSIIQFCVQIFLKNSSRVKFHVLADGQIIMSLKKHALLRQFVLRRLAKNRTVSGKTKQTFRIHALSWNS